MTDDKPRVLLSLPTTGWVRTELLNRLPAWLGSGEVAGIYTTLEVKPVTPARNRIVSRFLETDLEYLWMVDSDTVPPKGALEKLLEDDKDVVSGIVPVLKQTEQGRMRYPSVYRGSEESYTTANFDEQGLKKVDAVGAACMLVKREVLEALDAPWFEPELSGSSLRRKVGEDVGFCQKAQEAGFEVWADFDIPCDHHKEIGLRCG